MRQLFQSASNGDTRVVEVPAPMALPGQILVRNAYSLISAGTERTSVEFARKSLLQKARSRPDLVRKVLDKARTEGVLTALDTARTRLDEPMTLGYSSAGTVVEVGPGVEGFAVGDRVACAGQGYASHAEMVAVPVNLVAHVPDAVGFEAAAFTTVGTIALHGVRLAEPALGETVAVIGLGLIGLITVQLLVASGVTVVGVDPDPGRCRLALELGAAAALSPDEDPALAVDSLSAGIGADAVLITAGTSSNQPVEMAAALARDRGKVVVVGAVGLELPREPYFKKELSFRVSRSYGPGRYDARYEEGGIDYPEGFVRWTEGRNLDAFLGLLAAGRVRTEPLVSATHPLDDAVEAYGEIMRGEGLAVLLRYPESDEAPQRVVRLAGTAPAGAGDVGLGVLGAGNFATATLLPAARDAGGFRFVAIASAGGVSARHAAESFGFGLAATDEAAVLSEDGVDVVAVLTRHDLHARQIQAALEAGKHVFCEKPPALNAEELAGVVRALHGAPSPRHLLVGYNRRFSPMIGQVRTFFEPVIEPRIVSCRVNAGTIPGDHWIQDPLVGGGRVVGEACHFVDLMICLTGSLPTRVHAVATPDGGRYRGDNLVITLAFADGSAGSLIYTAAGDKALGKERVELHAGGRSAVVDDFRAVELVRGGRTSTSRDRLRQDKGHRAEWEAFRTALSVGGAPPIPLEEWVATSLVTFAVGEALVTGDAVAVDAPGFIRAAMVGAAPHRSDP